jgi:hypothetical protein
MPKQVALHQLQDLSHGESKNEILLDTNPNTELHLIQEPDRTIIMFPYGNKFDVINGMIVIHE